MEILKWDACTMEPCPALRWLECHPAFTAAAAALVVGFVAVYVPLRLWRQDNARRQKERYETSGAFVASLLSPMSGVRMDVARARNRLRTLEESTPGWLGIPDTLRQAKLILPEFVVAAMGQLHNFDNSVVGPTRTAITAVYAYNVMAENLWLAASDDLSRFENNRKVILATLKRALEVAHEELTRVIGLPVVEKPAEKQAK